MKKILGLMFLLAFISGCVFYAKGLDLQSGGTLVKDQEGRCYVMKQDKEGKAFLVPLEKCPE